jgi:hypothetical protein
MRESSNFCNAVTEHFAFLGKFGAIASGTRRVGGADPRDASIASRYIGPDWRIDIGWSSIELSLAILIKIDRSNFSRADSYVYFEPFVEFATDGQEKAVVPYITENMSIRSIENAMQRRQSVFELGLEPVVAALSRKAERLLPRVLAAPTDEILAYHVWMSKIR